MTTIALNVPRERKDEAKALGARWDRFRKTWYVKIGADLTPFAALGFHNAPATTADGYSASVGLALAGGFRL